MTLHRFIPKAIMKSAAVLVLAGASMAPALAQQMVSIRGDTVNMRAAPGQRGEVLWQLGSGYPLKVIGRQGSWLKVSDFENDRGWVASSLTAKAPSFVVKSPTANLRAGPGTQYRVVDKASYGDVFRTVEKRKAWVRVRDEGGRKGWIARRLLWGW